MKMRHSMHGFTMLEVLISIVVIAFGLLGIAGLQAFAIKNNQSASMRVVATALAMDIVDRAHSNWQGLFDGGYNMPTASSYTTAVGACNTASGCTGVQLAQNDRFEWLTQVTRSLPNGAGIVCIDSTPNDGSDASNAACDGVGVNNYVVKIWWRDDRTVTGSAAAAGPTAPQRVVWPFLP